ncbi:hypothetical protein Patl1_18587 [Pistacia atlantica]|uniref:Uncharacterized protein n=1 Tax=Pistacia atlantica TaxID=434234 RepID=A0ACC1C3A2_9ROSI|nr:hypothetical protein Patl1_18587 [Pistacia atlantica]
MDLVCGTPIKVTPLEGLRSFHVGCRAIALWVSIAQGFAPSSVVSRRARKALRGSSSVFAKASSEEVIGHFVNHLHLHMRALVMGVSKESWTTLRGFSLVALLQKVAHDLTQVAYLCKLASSYWLSAINFSVLSPRFLSYGKLAISPRIDKVILGPGLGAAKGGAKGISEAE